MSYIVAIAGQKGGSGKSTTAVNLATEWVHRGLRVLLVDADPQGSVRVWGEVAAEDGAPAPPVIAVGAGFHVSGQLIEISRNFDLTIIDCPGRQGLIQRQALSLADLAIVPYAPMGVETWALGESIQVVKEAQALRPELRAGIFVTRLMPRTKLGQSLDASLADCGLHVFKTRWGFRVDYPTAFTLGRGVVDYQPRGKAAAEVRELVEEIEEILGGEDDG